jgi:predicted HTH domain antitoxin
MKITLEIPDFAPLVLNKDLNELKEEIKLSSALFLYKKGKLSLEQASPFAKLSIYDFLKECKKNAISNINYNDSELKNELEMLKNL